MAANGCSKCGPGTYQGESGYDGWLCTECPTGTFAPNESMAACVDCYKPICARAVTSCNALSGLQQTFTYYDPFEALSIKCSPANATDACSAPHLCLSGVAQCGREERRYPMRLLGPGGVGSLYWDGHLRTG